MPTIAEAPVLQRNPTVAAQLIALWSLPVFALVFAVAFLALPGFHPPMSPQASADQVAQFYREHTAMIRFSMITYNLCGIMLVPFFTVIVVQMKRMATPSQVLAYCYLTAVVSGATLFALADLFWLIAAFRPERSPDLTMLLNDMAWITFTAPVGMLIVQNLCLALAVYLDAGPAPVFPRWIAPLNIVIAAAMAPAAGAAAWRCGPLAWDGAVSFWGRLATFGGYLAVMFAVTLAAVRREAEEQRMPQ